MIIILFTPNAEEQKMIEQVLRFHPDEYVVVRLTPTMLTKSIIDASGLIKNLLKQGNVVDYSNIDQGPEHKIIKDVVFLSNEELDLKTSFYRPNTKKGDPRLWFNGIKKHIHADDMIMLTVLNSKVIVVPLVKDIFNSNTLSNYFGSPDDDIVKKELIDLMKTIARKKFILSVSPSKKFAKDVGETFERELNIHPNCDKLADFKGQIELKAKRSNVKTRDTLFSMVPDWSNSPIGGSNQMIQQFGYPSRKYEDFLDLYVTVGNKPNAQGLFLVVDEEKEQIQQYHLSPNGKKTLTCFWEFNAVKERLYNKHKETMWIIADEQVIDGNISFHYFSAEYTRKPIFSSFLLLISSGIVTFDWRGRVRKDGTGYKDKGHCFRIAPKNRSLLFGETEQIDLT